MTHGMAIDALVRKFTNYRGSRKKAVELEGVDGDSMKLAASALFDLKSFSGGRNTFKRRNQSEIMARRDAIMKELPEISKVGAYQKAFKQLWSSTDQEYWEAQATSDASDIYQ